MITNVLRDVEHWHSQDYIYFHNGLQVYYTCVYVILLISLKKTSVLRYANFCENRRFLAVLHSYLLHRIPLKSNNKYRVIHKSLWEFRPLRYSSRDGHAAGEHVNRGRDTPNLCPTLQVTVPATVPQGSEFPEGLMNNPV
jgi:hypothetical protein